MSRREKQPKSVVEAASFPPEAYAYDADVTPEAVAAICAKVPESFKSPEWKVIDGPNWIVAA
jgi:hypothetical protein